MTTPTSPANRSRHTPVAIPAGFNPQLTTTTFTIEGYRIVKTLGVIRGVTVRSRSLFGTLGGVFQSMAGGNVWLFTDLCEKTRAEALALCITHAQEVGANAIIGVRYDATEIMQGTTEVLCYGTAVIVEPA